MDTLENKGSEQSILIHSAEVTRWRKKLETVPPLQEVLRMIQNLQPGELLKNEKGQKLVVAVVQVPELEQTDSTEDVNCSTQVYVTALEDAARALDIHLPKICVYTQRTLGLPQVDGKNYFATLSGIQSMEREPKMEMSDSERFGENFDAIAASIKSGKEVGFSFLPPDIEKMSIQFLREFLDSMGISTNHMHCTIKTELSSGSQTNHWISVEFTPIDTSTRTRVHRIFND